MSRINKIEEFLKKEEEQTKEIVDRKDQDEFVMGKQERMLMLDYCDEHPPVIKIKGGEVYILVSRSTLNFTQRLLNLVEKLEGKSLNETKRETIIQVSILITTNTRWDAGRYEGESRLTELDKDPEYIVKEDTVEEIEAQDDVEVLG